MTTSVRPGPTELFWHDDDAHVADSYRGGGRKQAILRNVNELADACAALIGFTPDQRFLDRSSYGYNFLIADEYRMGARYGGPAGGVLRAVTLGLPVTALCCVAAPFVAAKDLADILGHTVAAALGR